MLLDVPFPISIPSAAYFVFDPVKGVAVIEVSMQEGSLESIRPEPTYSGSHFFHRFAAGFSRYGATRSG
jgi:hypothetical protein